MKFKDLYKFRGCLISIVMDANKQIDSKMLLAKSKQLTPEEKDKMDKFISFQVNRKKKAKDKLYELEEKLMNIEI